MPNYRIVYKIDDFAHMIEVKAPDKETAMKHFENCRGCGSDNTLLVEVAEQKER